MSVENLITAKSRSELRGWLEENSTREHFCWVVVSVKPEPGVVQYLDAVEEALCFGWIDGTKKKISDAEVAQRLSPRRKGSNWTELNKARVRRLERLGLMKEEGRKVLPDMRHESFVIDKEIVCRLNEDRQTFENFMNFPALYRVIRVDTIQSYKSDVELFNKRLDKFIENTKANKMYGQWNDGGRLVE